MASLQAFLDNQKDRGIAASTNNSYNKVWRKFIDFCQALDQKLDSWEDRILLFVPYLAEKKYAASTIKTYLAAIRNRLTTEGTILRENKYLIGLLIKARQKEQWEELKLPITKYILHRLLRAIQFVESNEYDIALFRAMFVTAYQGLFRISELCDSEHAITSRNVGISNQGNVKIILETAKNISKGDPPKVVGSEKLRTEWTGAQQQ